MEKGRDVGGEGKEVEKEKGKNNERFEGDVPAISKKTAMKEHARTTAYYVKDYVNTLQRNVGKLGDHLRGNYHPFVDTALLFLVMLILFILCKYVGVLPIWLIAVACACAYEMSLNAEDRCRLFDEVASATPADTAGIEKCAWMNEVIERVYLTTVPGFARNILDTIIMPIVRDVLPDGLGVEIIELNFGTRAPVVEFVRMRDAVLEDQIEMDLHIQFASEVTILLEVKVYSLTVPVRVSGVVLDQMVRAQIHLHPSVVMESVVGISLLHTPRFDLVIQPFYPKFSVDLFSLPFVRRISRMALGLILEQLKFMAPLYFCLTFGGALLNGFIDESDSPIVEVSVFRPLEEQVPPGHRLLGVSVSGHHPADIGWPGLGMTSKSPCYITYRRAEPGEQLSPIVDINVYVEYHDAVRRKIQFQPPVPDGYEVLRLTQSGKLDANLNNGKVRIYLAILRASSPSTLVKIPAYKRRPITQLGIFFPMHERFPPNALGWKINYTTPLGEIGTLNYGCKDRTKLILLCQKVTCDPRVSLTACVKYIESGLNKEIMFRPFCSHLSTLFISVCVELLLFHIFSSIVAVRDMSTAGNYQNAHTRSLYRFALSLGWSGASKDGL